jgi:hypothetical protein
MELKPPTCCTNLLQLQALFLQERYLEAIPYCLDIRTERCAAYPAADAETDGLGRSLMDKELLGWCNLDEPVSPPRTEIACLCNRIASALVLNSATAAFYSLTLMSDIKRKSIWERQTEMPLYNPGIPAYLKALHAMYTREQGLIERATSIFQQFVTTQSELLEF